MYNIKICKSIILAQVRESIEGSRAIDFGEGVVPKFMRHHQTPSTAHFEAPNLGV